MLLNNYATNVRMARSRLPGVWPERAREIARLTAFQTEFPDFAADLSLEPRLPRFLMHHKDLPTSDNVAYALRRWDVKPDAVAQGEADAALDDPDAFLPVVEGDPDSGDSHTAPAPTSLKGASAWRSAAAMSCAVT